MHAASKPAKWHNCHGCGTACTHLPSTQALAPQLCMRHGSGGCRAPSLPAGAAAGGGGGGGEALTLLNPMGGPIALQMHQSM